MDLRTVGDILHSYPRTYKDFTTIISPDDAEVGSEGLFFGRLVDLNERNLSRNRRLIQGRLVGQRKVLTLSWFTAAYHRGYSYQYRQLAKVKELWVYGQVKQGFYGPEIAGGEFYTSQPKHRSLVPVYPLVSGVTNRMRLEWIEFALQYLDLVEECLPPHLLSQFIPRKQAIRAIHFPTSQEELAQAKKRLIFEEFFSFQFGSYLPYSGISCQSAGRQFD